MTRVVVLGCLVCAAGCWDGGDEIPENTNVDPTYRADADQVRLSAVDAENRMVVVGLQGALPAGALYKIVQEGKDDVLAEGLATAQGTFVAWIDSPLARPVLRPLKPEGGRGPDQPLIRPTGTPLRRVSPSLTVPLTSAQELNVHGLAGAAASSARVVVGDLATGLTLEVVADGSGAFHGQLIASGSEQLSLFQYPTQGTDDASSAITLPAGPGDFPVLISAARATPTGVVLLAAPSNVPGPVSKVTVTTGETAVPVGDLQVPEQGGFGGCVDGLTGGQLVTVNADGASAWSSQRDVPGDVSLVQLLNPSISSSAFDSKVTIKGTAPAALAQVLLVSCETGTWTRSAVAANGTISLLIDAEPGELLGLVGLGDNGEVGVAQFLFAGQVQEAVVPVPRPDAFLINASALHDGRVVVTGLSDTVGGAVLPGGWLEIQRPPSIAELFQANAQGEFAAAVDGLESGATLSLVQVVGPFRSKPLELVVDIWSAELPLPPVPGLISVIRNDDGDAELLAEPWALPDADVIVANLTRGTTQRVDGIDGSVARTISLAGEQGDLIAVYPIAQGDTYGSVATTRLARSFDVPYLVSAAGATGCAIGLPTVQATGLVAAVEPQGADPVAVPLAAHPQGGFRVLFSGADLSNSDGVQLAIDGPEGRTLRPVPVADSADPSNLSLVGSADAIIVSSGSALIGTEWLLMLATPDGRSALVRPPSVAPWTVEADLPGASSVAVFGWHIPTGRATGCVEIDLSVEVPDPPTITVVEPDPLVVGKAFDVYGTHLAGAVVTIGGVQQTLGPVTNAQLEGVVALGTPLDQQTLVVTTSGGVAEVTVELVSPPIIETIEPNPLVVGQLATVSGAHFGEAPLAVLASVNLELLQGAGPTQLSFIVPATVPAGVHNLKVQSDIGTANTSVEVLCKPPALTVVPSTLFLGDTILLSGDHLLGASVTVAGQVQQVIETSNNQLTVLLSATLPLGDGQLVVATACGELSTPVVIATAKPIIDELVPAAAVLEAELNLYGDHLAGASVTIGGWAQTLTIDSKKGLSLVVHASTPLGNQPLVVTTLGGEATVTVGVFAPPTIDTVTPDPVTAGSILNVFGEHLLQGVVDIAGVKADPVSNTATYLQVTVSPDTPAGPQTVTVTTPAGTATAIVTVIASPVINQTKPAVANLGKPLAILGKNFIEPSVTLAGVTQTITGSTPTKIDIVVNPSVPQGQQTLVVTANGGQDSITIVVNEGPDIALVEPDPLVVGGPYTLTGTKLGAGTAQVTIGGVVQAVQSSSNTEVLGVVSPGTPVGEQSLVLKTSEGQDLVLITVVGAPDVSGATPNPIAVGGQLTILGTGLDSSTVTIGGLAAEVLESSGNKLVVLVPAQTPPGLQTVTVTNIAGQDSTQVTIKTPSPVIDTVSPDPVFVDEPIVITGEYLLGAKVTVGNTPVTITSAAFGQITGTLSPVTPFGESIQLILTTPGGTAQTTVTVSDGTPPGPPSITTIDPPEALIGALVTLDGANLKAAVVTIGNKQQSIGLNTNTQIVFTLAAGTPVGAQTLTVTTVKGEAMASFKVLVPPPQITSVSPDPVQATELLTVEGQYLGAFTETTLGGVKQNVFYTVTNAKLVFQVAFQTPTGPDIELVITTPGGVVKATVDVTAAPFKPPIITSVDPEEVAHGDTVVVLGSGLLGASFSIGGVGHQPQEGSADFITILTVDGDVPAGSQVVEATKAGAAASTHDIFVLPDAPAAPLVYQSAIGTADEVVLVGLPGAVEPGAVVNISVDAGLVSVTANADGSFSTLLTNVAPNADLSISQLVDGAISASVDRVLGLPLDDAPATPHQFLMRVEQSPGGVLVYGPAPTFGPDPTLIMVATENKVDFATAGELHADPTTGILVAGATQAGSPVTVFAAGADPEDPASAPVLTFAVPYDPPMLTSGVAGGALCLAGLAGSLDGIYSLGLENDSGAEVPFQNLVDQAGLGGELSVRATLAVGAPMGPYEWVGMVGTHDLSVLVPTQVDPPLTPGQFTIDTGIGTSISVNVVAGTLPTGTLLVGATPDGASGVAFVHPDGSADLALTSKSKTLWLWTVSLIGGSATPCLELVL